LPALKAIAPTQKESPFVIAQLVVLALFGFLAVLAADPVPRRAPDERLTGCDLTVEKRSTSSVEGAHRPPVEGCS